MNPLFDFISYTFQLLSTVVTKPVKDVKTEEVKNAYKWLLEKIKDESNKEVQKSSEPWLTPGKIYIFKYEPKPDIYEYWDKHPIVLALGKMKYNNGKTYNVGLNISWYPPKARKYIIEDIRKMYKRDIDKEIKNQPYKAIDQKGYYIDLYTLKLKLDKIGLSFAIRNYDPTKIKSPKYCLAYEHWEKAVRLDQPMVFPELKGKFTIADIYEKYKKYVLNYSQHRGIILQKMEESKKQNKYRFIK